MTKEEMKDYQREYAKERYEWMKSHKICTKCGRENAVEGITFCEACRKKKYARAKSLRETATAEQKKQYKHKYYEKFIESGICPRCRIRPLQENRKKCSVCLEKMKQYAEIQRKRRGK